MSTREYSLVLVEDISVPVPVDVNVPVGDDDGVGASGVDESPRVRRRAKHHPINTPINNTTTKPPTDPPTIAAIGKEDSEEAVDSKRADDDDNVELPSAVVVPLLVVEDESVVCDGKVSLSSIVVVDSVADRRLNVWGVGVVKQGRTNPGVSRTLSCSV